jgi:hypothetical protein
MTDYLWDGSGKPDEEVARLEAMLAQYRHRGTAPAFPVSARRRRWTTILPVLTAAASVALVVSAARFAFEARQASWTVHPIAGAPHVANAPIADASPLTIGQALVTDGTSRARLEVGSIGEVDVEPNSRLRLLRAREGEHRMALDEGTISARIWAPPREFFVNTASAIAVDLGCAYTLHVDAGGRGLVRVEYGWVAYEYQGHESFIPQGAVCVTEPGIGPGTPHYADVSPDVAEALSILDFSSTGNVNRGPALTTVLDAARPRDGLTLWHLLTRGTSAERSRVYDRMAALIPPPQGVTRTAVLAGDRAALDAWWDALGLDSASWWHLWTSPWRQPGSSR